MEGFELITLKSYYWNIIITLNNYTPVNDNKTCSIYYLKQQLLKCLVPQALAHSLPQLSQLNATGFVDPNSQIATPKSNKLFLQQTFHHEFISLLTKHYHECKRNGLHDLTKVENSKKCTWMIFPSGHKTQNLFHSFRLSILRSLHFSWWDLITRRFEKKL